jgi:hypothetical protein
MVPFGCRCHKITSSIEADVTETALKFGFFDFRDLMAL